MGKDLLKLDLIEKGKELGFSMVRTTRPDPLELWKTQADSRGQKDPKSSYLWDNMPYDPKKLMPEVKSIIIGVWPHIPYRARFPKGIARFSAHYKEYPKGRDAAQRLGEFLEDQGYKAMVHSPLPIKELAHRAGIGYFGKNGLIHTDEHGSLISLHPILTDASLSSDSPMDRISDCGDCRLCMDACPTGAIEEEGQITPSKCIRHHMLSSKLVPVDIRDKMGTNILGCDICQRACPFNRQRILEAILPTGEDMELFNISEILEEGSTSLKIRIDKMGDLIGRNYARAQRVLSTAIILAGNSGDKAYIPYLKELLKHPHPPIKEHSAWAIDKIYKYKREEVEQ